MAALFHKNKVSFTTFYDHLTTPSPIISPIIRHLRVKIFQKKRDFMNEIIVIIEDKRLSGKRSSRNKKRLPTSISMFNTFLTSSLLILQLYGYLMLTITKK